MVARRGQDPRLHLSVQPDANVGLAHGGSPRGGDGSGSTRGGSGSGSTRGGSGSGSTGIERNWTVGAWRRAASSYETLHAYGPSLDAEKNR